MSAAMPCPSHQRVGQGFAALFGAYQVQHADQVGRGVEQRAVEIEQHGADVGTFQAGGPPGQRWAT